ncbi:MAG: hypothetical protein FWE22_04260 [Firmicutes bacterium]|nr:hypothetical protein [Bacillota bacterium]
METEKPYFNQYCNLTYEWHCQKIDVDDVPEEETDFARDLLKKATAQSGLTENELLLISTCRKFNILKKVRNFVRKVKNEN